MTASDFSLQWTSQSFVSPRDLYQSMRTKAFIRRIFSILTGHSSSLLDLTTEVTKKEIRSQHYAGARTVPINRIRGSEGRSSDFDREFSPLNSRIVDRWMSIAVARSDGVTLPPVELIQLGKDYFVRDGHHRISVARALGEEYIDAMVTVLQNEK